LLTLLPCRLPAAGPVLDHIYPVAVQAGTTNTLVALGKFDPWPAQLRTLSPGIEFQPESTAGRYQVRVDANAHPGPHLIWACNDSGASGPRFFIVTAEAQVAETEPNDRLEAAQALAALPAAINGRLERVGDVDRFVVTLAAGQTLTASAQAHTLGSGIDAALAILDPRGVQMAWNHDDGRTLDPLLRWTAPASGRWIVQLFGFSYPATSEVRFHGSDRCVYRLHLDAGPAVTHTMPLAAARGSPSLLQLAGVNLGALPESRIRLDPARCQGSNDAAVVAVPGLPRPLVVPLGERSEQIEHEPNDTAAQAPLLEIGSGVSGTIGSAGDEDRVAFDLAQGGRVSLAVHAAALGFPLDAWLRVEDTNGAELARSDDVEGADPRFEWTAPASGRYVAAVGHVLRRGGSEYAYRLVLTSPRPPSFSSTISQSVLSCAPNSTNELKLTFTRVSGHSAPLRVNVRGLPAGLHAEPVEVPEKAVESTLKIVVGADAPVFNGPVRVAVSDGAREIKALVRLTSGGENNGVPQGFRDLVIRDTPDLWLSVTRPAPPPPEPVKKSH
jgi:hypothetical protein